MILRSYQQAEVDANRPKWGLFFEMRLGKSFTAIELVRKNNEKAIVIVPKGIKKNWEIEAEKCGYAHSLFIITKETFRRDHKELPRYNAVIVDECHWFSGHKSQMTKSLAAYITKNNPYFVWMLSGTPYLSSAWGIWTLGRLLGRSGGIWNYNTFRNKFFFPMRMGMRTIWVQRKGIEKELADLTKTIGSVVKMSDHIDFPEEFSEIEYVELTKDQKKAVKLIEENEILALPKTTRLHQVCGGSVKEIYYIPDRRFSTDKVERMLAFISEHGKAIIACKYNGEVDLLLEIIKDRPVFILTGDTKDRYDVIHQYEACEKATLIANVSCCEGWQSETTAAMLFWSMSWSLKDNLQLRARIKIPAFPKKLYYKYLITKDTVDEDVYENIMVKKMDYQVELYKK